MSDEQEGGQEEEIFYKMVNGIRMPMTEEETAQQKALIAFYNSPSETKKRKHEQDVFTCQNIMNAFEQYWVLQDPPVDKLLWFAENHYKLFPLLDKGCVQSSYDYISEKMIVDVNYFPQEDKDYFLSLFPDSVKNPS